MEQFIEATLELLFFEQKTRFSKWVANYKAAVIILSG
jgi:hypothetical protein